MAGDFGDPAYGLLSWAWEVDGPGVPPVAGWHDLNFSGETLSNNATTLERQNITRAAMTPAPLDSKIETGGDYKVDAMNPEQEWGALAQIFGAAKDPVEFETDAFRHKLSRLETDITFDPTFAIRAWRNDGMGQLLPGCRVNQIQIAWSERQLVGATIGVVNMLGDYWDTPTRTTGTGTVLPRLLGLSDLNFDPSATTKNIHIKIISQTGTAVTFKAKVGDATTYDGADQVATKGSTTWFWVRDESDVLLGTRGIPVEILFPTGTYVAADEFKFLNRRGEWVPSFPDDTIVCLEVYSSIYINGVEIEVETGGLTIAKPAEPKFGFGRRGPRRTRSRGQQTVKWTIGREYLDLAFRKRLELGTSFRAELQLRSKVGIGTTGDFQQSIGFVSPLCRASGKTASVESKTAANESIEATAHPSDDATDPADISCYIINSIPDLEAA